MRFDARGFTIAGIAIAALILAAETRELAPAWARWTLAAVGALAFAAYVRHALRTPDPVLDLRLFRHVTLAVSLIAGSLARVSVGALPFLLPLMLQVGMGISPFATSYVTVAMALGTLSARFTAPRIINALGFRRALLALAAVGAFIGLGPAFFRVDTPIEVIAVVMCLASVMRAAFLVTSTTLVYADIAPREIGAATVLMAVTQQLSLGLGISLSGWLLERSRGASEVLVPEHFAPAFIVLAALGALSMLAIARLPRDAAAALRGGSGSD
jgi:hypothetical protein